MQKSTEQEKIIQEAYNIGNISHIDYLSQIFEIESQRYSAKEAKLKYHIAISKIELIEDGILLE